MSIIDLDPSKLGTKEHWDSVYEEELANFEEIGDEGEIWFGMESVEKMVEWSQQNIPPEENPLILEVGSGNGILLFALLKAGYDPARLCGIDYSADAVKLAQAVASTHGAAGILFAECDFLHEDPPILPSMGSKTTTGNWHLLLDKGTYDAIALGEKDVNGRSPAANYLRRIQRLLRPGGYFLITSCNFTEDELKASFATPETGIVYHSRIEHPKFTFGGKTGSVVSSVAFRKPIPT